MKRLNALLVEIMIAVLFFSLASTVILETFAATRAQSDLSERANDILLCTQDTLDALYAADDPSAALTALGYAEADDRWILDGNPRFAAVVSETAVDFGAMRTYCVQALDDEGSVLYELNGCRYLPKEETK